MLDDVLEPGLALVVCGSAAGTASARARCYYAGPGNKFWRTLAETGLTPMQLEPEQFRLLPGYGIGLTDVAKGRSGGDAEIRFTREDAAILREKIERFQPRVLCFNGKRAAREYLRTRSVGYGLQADEIGPTVVFVTPSTSGAASGAWDVSVWHDLAALVRERSRGARGAQ